MDQFLVSGHLSNACLKLKWLTALKKLMTYLKKNVIIDWGLVSSVETNRLGGLYTHSRQGRERTEEQTHCWFGFSSNFETM